MSIRVEGAAKVAADTQEIADRLRDPSPALAVEIGILEAMIAHAFDRDTGPAGSRWAPRAVVTVRAGNRARKRSRHEGRHSLLEKTGTLRKGISVRPESTTRIVVESTAPYSGFLHSGTRYMRARPFLPLDSNFEPATTGEAGEWWAGFAARLADYVAEGKIGGRSGR